MTPPPIDSAQREADLRSRNPPVELDREFEVTRSYAQAVIQVGEKTGVQVVDIWQAIWQAAGEKESGLPPLLNDGLHLTAAGYGVRSTTSQRTITLIT